MQKLVRVASALSIAYAVAVLVWQGLRLTLGDRWWLGMANAVSLYLFLPLLSLLPLGVWVMLLRPAGRSRWLPIAATAVPLVVWTLLYGGLFLPRRAPVSAQGTVPLRVLTFNVLYSAGDVEGLEQFIRAESPDLVLLQELTPAVARELAPRLKAEYPHKILLPQEGTTGLGIWSHHPLQDGGTLPEPDWGYGGWPNSTQVATMTYEGRPVLVFNVHALPPARPWNGYPVRWWPEILRFEFLYREEEVRRLVTRAAQHDGPVIAAGDFNFTDQNAAYDLMAAQLEDAHRKIGWGFGHTNPAMRATMAGIPVPPRSFRIDYVWYSHHWQALDVGVAGPVAGSDHLPVLASLVLK